MSSKKPARSIASRVVRAWMTRTVFVLIDVDIALLVLARMGEAHLSFWPGLVILAGVELLTLVMVRRSARKKAGRLVEPLERMARTAQEITSAEFDPERLKQLEDAISGVAPQNPHAHIATGDKGLNGLESAINDLLTRMNESYQERSRFVSDASHELRTPIAVIQGYADMLQRWGKEDEKVLDEGISAIQSETAHMKKLVEQLLFLARGDSGRTALSIGDVELGALMREVYEESRMIYPERDWHLDAASPVPARGDADMLKQAVRILTDNAVKYTHGGDRISLRAQLKDGCPCLEVQDNGIGIKPEDVPHIFERFFRSDPARSRASGGTGLGLSIAKWIVDRHGGHFEVYSREDIGTKIAIVLSPAPALAEEENGAGEKASG